MSSGSGLFPDDWEDIEQIDLTGGTNSRDELIQQVQTVFPGICQEYVSSLYESCSHSSEVIIDHILQNVEEGIAFPKEKDSRNLLKRKRQSKEELEAERQGNTNLILHEGKVYAYVRQLISYEFRDMPIQYIDMTLTREQCRITAAYQILAKSAHEFDPNRPPYHRLRRLRKVPSPDEIDSSLTASDINSEFRTEILRELHDARQARLLIDEERRAVAVKAEEEERNLLLAQQQGNMTECGCCFSEYPINRMVHCNNETILHWFCRSCARQNAEVAVGCGKYQFYCMSTDGCESDFALTERSQFLDDKITIALERIEQETVLRMAGIENLASCPFCPYAAEYPSVEIDREFRCRAPDCEKVSCRLCKLESHIPMSCEEIKKTGVSIRTQIEEAMSAALIRRCFKCNTPFVKETGCNKMTCHTMGCGGLQCYVCSKPVTDYSHFQDNTGRINPGGSGSCPLYDDQERRHDHDVQKAEEETLAKIRAKFPHLMEDQIQALVSVDERNDKEAQANNSQKSAATPVPAAIQIPPPLPFGRPDNLLRPTPRLDNFNRPIARVPFRAPPHLMREELRKEFNPVQDERRGLVNLPDFVPIRAIQRFEMQQPWRPDLGGNANFSQKETLTNIDPQAGQDRTLIKKR